MIAVVKFRIPHQGGSFEWKDYGLKLHVHKGSFPAGMEECKIGMSLSGQFQLPRDSDKIKCNIPQAMYLLRLCFRPKMASEAISEHQIFEKFPQGACPHIPLLCMLMHIHQTFM